MVERYQAAGSPTGGRAVRPPIGAIGMGPERSGMSTHRDATERSAMMA
jgi:hypothetical protein